MDDPDCDSTWEEDEDEDGEGASAGGDEDGEAGAPGDADAEDEDEDEEDAPAARPGALQARTTGSRNWRAARDTRRYRHHYPDLIERDGNGDMPNLSFYRNEIRFLPNGCFIEDILQNWREDYDVLEENHSYIQWLFPLREPGVNWHAKPLTLREVEAFKSCKEVRERFVQAYELMLGFYGIQLEDRSSGQVRRAQNYQKRFQNLNWHSHNNLRITRILKSLGELGLERYQAPLARFFLEETLVRQELPAVRQSALDYFVFTVRCPRQRRQLLRFAWEHFRPRRKFVWGPHDKLRRLRPPLPAGEGEGEGEGSSPDPLPGAGASGGQTGAPGRAGGQEGEAGGRGEGGPEPPSPKENKKRKLDASRREQAPGERGGQSASDVEKIALNLEGCALSQGGLSGGTQESGSRAPGEAEQPCPQPPPGAKVVEEVRKRRKVDRGPGSGDSVGAGGGAEPPAPARRCALPGGPEAREEDNGVEEAGGRAELEQGAPGSSAPAGPSVDREAEAGPAAKPRKP